MSTKQDFINMLNSVLHNKGYFEVTQIYKRAINQEAYREATVTLDFLYENANTKENQKILENLISFI